MAEKPDYLALTIRGICTLFVVAIGVYAAYLCAMATVVGQIPRWSAILFLGPTASLFWIGAWVSMVIGTGAEYGIYFWFLFPRPTIRRVVTIATVHLVGAAIAMAFYSALQKLWV